MGRAAPLRPLPPTPSPGGEGELRSGNAAPKPKTAAIPRHYPPPLGGGVSRGRRRHPLWLCPTFAEESSEEGEGHVFRRETVSQRNPWGRGKKSFSTPGRVAGETQRRGAGAPCLPRIRPCLATPDGAQRRSGVQEPVLSLSKVLQATPFGSALRLRSGQAPDAPFVAAPDGAQRRSGDQEPRAEAFRVAPGPRNKSGAAKVLGFREIGSGRRPGFPRDTPPPCIRAAL